MTLGPGQEHVMTAKPKQQDEPFDAERFRRELDLKIQRLLAETIEGWPTCPNVSCRRAKRCASQDYECIAKWRESLPPLSPEEAEASMQDLRIAIAVRKRLGGDSVAPGQLEKAVHDEKAARRAAMQPPIAEETQLAPEQQERIDRAWNDDAASSPAKRHTTRERRPRITQL
jgi:hypothetical protein